MAKKKHMDLGIAFQTAAIIADGEPKLFMAILGLFVHAAQPDAPPQNNSANHNNQHTAQARLLTRNHR